ncbi:glycosyltransferase family 2 protein [Nakamurella endophytica]|uniref:Glycosyl transferase n=1 Tax=Nakamurella endophytica TaxID=1748367 RepID=A0A917T3P2_9ACTN|nr:glycosyltransferase [Nakamurella endophytica]GGM08213.1 glycosyl transferase [Nakamurella endophytica]
MSTTVPAPEAAAPPAGAVPPDEDPRVTVVVMSRNRRDELLGSLGRHRAPVVLVDNGSDDGTADAVHRAHPRVQLVPLPDNVGAHARTIGVRRAATEFVAFADDDSWWAPGSLAAAADVLAAHPDVAVVQARVLVGPEERLDGLCAQLPDSPLPRPAGAPGPVLLGFIACGAMVRRSAFLAAGGFDDVVRFPGEEERLALDLATAGSLIVYRDDVVVHHHPSPRRHDRAARVAAVTRSALLTAVQRLPWTWVGRALLRAVRGGPATRAGVRAALPDLAAALRARRVVPPHVRALRRMLE